MENKNELALAEILKAHEKEFRLAAPKYVKVERLMGLAIQAKLRSPILAKCSPASVVDFCMKMAETGTDRIGAGGMWAVPFRNTKTGNFDMAAIPDWRLMIEKARRQRLSNMQRQKRFTRMTCLNMRKG